MSVAETYHEFEIAYNTQAQHVHFEAGSAAGTNVCDGVLWHSALRRLSLQLRELVSVTRKEVSNAVHLQVA